MTDRPIVYPSSIPQDTDVLSTNQNAMVALGRFAQAVMGTNAVVDGLLCHQTAPASMHVVVDPGCIFVNQTIEATAYGALPISTSPLVKLGINNNATTFTLTAPGTSGQSINYLIEAQFSETDTGPVVLPYYNAANPAQPFSGPSNTGTPQNTLRSQIVALQLKASAPATSGSQITPSVDSGWVGLWIVTVAAGVTSIANDKITPYPGAPWLNCKLPQLTAVPRTLAKTNITFYVSPAGNDVLNTGLSQTSPFATAQHAANVIYGSYDWNGYAATIQMMAGTHTTPVVFTGMPVGMRVPITLIGNESNPSTVLISITTGIAVQAQLGALLSVAGMQIQASGISNTVIGIGYGVIANNAWINVQNLILGSCGTAQLIATTGGVVTNNAQNLTFTGTSGNGVQSSNSGMVWICWGSAQTPATTITLNSPVYTQSFALSTQNGNLSMAGNTYVGSATGIRYNAILNGSIYTNASTLPGSIAGTLSSGGVLT